MCHNEESEKSSSSTTPSARGLFDEIKTAIVSGISVEIERCMQPATKLRYQNAIHALRDASDNIEWIASNEFRLFAGRAQLIKNDISSIIAAYLSQVSPKK